MEVIDKLAATSAAVVTAVALSRTNYSFLCRRRLLAGCDLSSSKDGSCFGSHYIADRYSLALRVGLGIHRLCSVDS